MMTDILSPPIRRWLPLLILLVLGMIAYALPERMIQIIDKVGYAVCHRITARSFALGGQVLPVCARDTGMFLGALTGLAVLAAVAAPRAGWYPGKPYSLFFALCFLAWGFDGFNSYLLLLRGEVFLYAPQNWLRLLTGTLMGITLAAFALPLFNSGLWRDAAERPSVEHPAQLVALLVVTACVFGVVMFAPGWLYRPLMVLSSAGIAALLGLANAILAAIVLRRHGTVTDTKTALTFGVAGVIFALVELYVLVRLRLAFLPELTFGQAL